MRHPLEQRVEEVRALARRQLRSFGIARTCAAICIMLAVAAFFDYLLRFQDPGLRTLLSLACAAAIGWACHRFLLPTWRQSPSPLEIALRLEAFFPLLRHRLASALEFLQQPLDDHLAGSAALRRGVVIDAQALSEDLDFTRAVDRRPAKRAVVACLVVAGICLAAMCADIAVHWPAGRPANSLLALRRLALPWNELEWPRENHLVVRRPVGKLARGSDFEIEIVDAFNAPLPTDARIHYRHGDANASTEPLRPAAGALVARKEHVESSFAFRVEGGDERAFPWTDVEVIDPPEVERLAVKLHYPAYIGWPVATSPPLVRAWRGTRIELAGTNQQPLRSATVCLESGARFPAEITKDGRGFRLAADQDPAFAIEKSGAYWIELETKDGIRGGGDVRYEVRALEDTPPRVTLTRPKANAFVTPSAVVPIDLNVTDDLAIRQIGLRYLRSDQSDAGHQEVSLYQGPETQAAPRDGATARGETRPLAYAWELAPLALLPGAQLTVFGFAGDYRPQEGVSTERKLSVVTPEELLDRLSERQTLILTELARLLRLQHEARSQVESLQVQWKHVPGVVTQDVDRLHGGELTQRQVTRGLTDANDGVPAQVAAVIADLEINRLDHPDTLRQMLDVQATLSRLAAEPLPALEREFTASVKRAQQAAETSTAEAPTPLPQELSTSVDRVAVEQTRVVAELESLLARLNRWDALRRQLRDLVQLRQDQGVVAAQTLEIGRQTLARSLRNLAPAERAELERLALGQLELARRFDNLLVALSQAAEDLASNDTVAAQTIHDALEAARRASAAGEMRAAGQSVGENQIGQAAEQQERIVAALDAMLDALTNRQERELAERVEKLQAAAEQLASLGAQQAKLADEARRIAQSTASDATKREQLAQLAGEQQPLAAQTEQLARAFERLQAGEGAKSIAEAAAEMHTAEQQANAGAAEAAAQQAARAQQSLAAAQQKIADQQRQAEAELAEQTMNQLNGALTALGERQRKILEDTESLEAARLQNGPWTRAELAALRELAKTQTEAGAEAAAAARKLGNAPVLQRTLEGATSAMQSAASGLGEQDAGDRTQNAERRALNRLAQLLDALQPPPAAEPAPPDENSGSPEEGGEKPSGQTPAQAAQRLAELKMLKLLQVELYDNTRELEERRRRNGDLSPEERADLAELSAEQGRLAEMLLDLTKATRTEAADAPPLPEEMTPERELEPE